MLESFLEEEYISEAEGVVNRAGAYVASVDDWIIQLRYKTTFARILDANRKFLDASLRYYELSTSSQSNVILPLTI